MLSNKIINNERNQWRNMKSINNINNHSAESEIINNGRKLKAKANIEMASCQCQLMAIIIMLAWRKWHGANVM
jgi:hypothetical protein